jgi:hypothetical protein
MTANESDNSDRLFRRTEAANYLTETYGFPCSPKTLAKWACLTSDGPPFRMFGRTPLYPQSCLDAWVRSRLGPVVYSTSEATRFAEGRDLSSRRAQDVVTDLGIGQPINSEECSETADGVARESEGRSRPAALFRSKACAPGI